MTRDNINRRRVLTGAGVGIAGAMAGCLGGGGGDDDVQFLTDYYNDAWQALWDELEPDFEDETDIQMSIEEAGMSGSQESRLSQLIQAGNPPEANTSTFDQVADIWETDQLETVTDVVSSIEEVNGELNAGGAFLGEGDDIYQIPHGVYVSNFQYRADVYEALDLDVPETFSDILENARIIDEAGGDLEDMRGYGLAGAPTGKSQDEMLVLLASSGISGIGLAWKDPDAREELEINWPEDTVIEVLEYVDELSQYSPDPTSIGWSSSLSSWVQGSYGQCYHLNAWPAGVTALTAEAEDSDALRGVAEDTKVIAYPMLDGVDPDENWLSAPAPDGYHIFANSERPGDAKEWFEWLYADSMERTASFYGTDPGRFLPTYSDVLESDAFQNQGIYQAHPHLVEKLQYCQDEIWGNHYGSVEEANTSSPVSLYMQRQWFYGEMINRVVTDSMSPQEAYDWGYEQLEEAFAEAQDTFG
ncbi:ABC transporter substrate-binding protein [Natrinema sp. CBA1119]|uniref:ABC transporter substrate-binding protein n=1 Tax=Natrinema sp. CBA1119 TaxID=1608465 RepID=UPI00159BAD7A|nr:ABC transporter substrate-binding protein [Natrinema sp. CBA1119]